MDCPYKVYAFVDQKFTKETRCLKVSKRACPYIWYTLFIVHWYFFVFWGFFNKIVKKYDPSITHKDEHFPKYCNKIGWKFKFQFFYFPLFDPFYVKNGNSYIITLCMLSSVNLYILILSETTGPIGTKLGRNVQWIVPTKFMLLLIRSSLKKQDA
jgi:hypothetical protein